MGSAPKPPDPVATASAQTGLNIGTAVANGYLGQVNQNTPYGSLRYQQTGTTKWTNPVSGAVYDIPRTTAVQTLTPGGLDIHNKTMAAQQSMAGIAKDRAEALRGHLNTSLNTDGLPQVGNPNLQSKFGTSGIAKGLAVNPNVNQGNIANAGQVQGVGTGPKLNGNIANAGKITRSYGTDFSQDRAKVENALMARMQPGLTQDRKALEDRLASQGIGIGSEAYQQAFGDYGRQSNDARMSAILAGGQEQSRMVGMEADRAQFQNAAQAQQYGQNTNNAAFRNDALQQQYENRVGAQGFNNAAQAQRFGQNATRADFANDARQGNFQNAAVVNAANNAAQQQRFGQHAALAAFDNTRRLQQMQADQSRRNSMLSERTALRNQPINEIAALMGGSQVQQPNFMNIQGPQAATTDYAGLVNSNYAQQAQASQQRGASFGGLLGGFASMIPGFF